MPRRKPITNAELYAAVLQVGDTMGRFRASIEQITAYVAANKDIMPGGIARGITELGEAFQPHLEQSTVTERELLRIAEALRINDTPVDGETPRSTIVANLRALLADLEGEATPAT